MMCNTRRLTRLDALLHLLTGMAFSVAIGFGNPILSAYGFHSGQVGLVYSGAMVATILLQSGMSVLIEQRRLFSVIQSLRIVAAGGILSALLIPAVRHLPGTVAVLYLLLLAISTMALPTLGALTACWIGDGYAVNFGAARAMSSVGFSVVGFMGGFIMRTAGATTLLYLYVILQGLLIAASFICPRTAGGYPTADAGTVRFRTLFRQYPDFGRLLIGTVFLFFSHNLISNFLKDIVEHGGGGPVEYGVAVGLCTLLELPALFGFAMVRRRIRTVTLMQVSALFLTLKVLILTLSGSVYGIWGAQAVQSLAYGLYTPAVLYYVHETVAAKFQVRAQLAVGVATMGVGGAAGNFFGGYMIRYWGITITLAAATVVSAVGWIIFRNLKGGSRYGAEASADVEDI
ncbi:MAG: MFS transporter [Eubacteriales bacterium]|nr:MFS transporter [Eubacteriales bacterium]